jgi:UDP-N-acetylglucosamine 2-epimerase (non-hydrolysing)
MILISYGTRPEWIKVKPIIEEMMRIKIPFKTIFTGQHNNIVEELADYNLTIDDNLDNRLNQICVDILKAPSNIFDGIEYLLVQGDTTSVLSLALNAFHRKVKIIHLEAGLRTYDFDNPYPEEMNRQIVSRLADIHLCPTEMNKKNLIKENCGGQIFVVGNTSLDNLRDIKPFYGNSILITLHRRENHELVQSWFLEFSKLAEKYREYNFILPIHPNPNVIKHKNLLKLINVVEPMKHQDLLNVISGCRLIITDSGGLQEEGSFFNKRIVVCRKTTERPESLGVHSFLCEDPNSLSLIFDDLIKNYSVNSICPFGDGYASKKIVEIFKTLYDSQEK